MNPIVRFLAFVGRHGTVSFVAALLLGFALPGLASTMRPVLPVTIFCFTTLTFARADLFGVRRALSRPARLGLTCVWMTLAPAALIGTIAIVVGRDTIGPGLLLGLALVAAAPPLMGFAAYASLLGLDNSLALSILVITMAVTPAVAPTLASFVAGAAVPLDPWILGVRLLWILGGCGCAAFLLRRIVGPAALAARHHELNGVNVLLYFMFAIAAMDGVIDAAFAQPWRVLAFLLVATGVSIGGFALTAVGLFWLGRAESFVLGLGTGMRNTGLLVIALGASCPPDTFLFFSLNQVPIYCAPFVLAPMARRLRRPETGTGLAT